MEDGNFLNENEIIVENGNSWNNSKWKKHTKLFHQFENNLGLLEDSLEKSDIVTAQMVSLFAIIFAPLPSLPPSLSHIRF